MTERDIQRILSESAKRVRAMSKPERRTLLRNAGWIKTVGSDDWRHPTFWQENGEHSTFTLTAAARTTLAEAAGFSVSEICGERNAQGYPPT